MVRLQACLVLVAFVAAAFGGVLPRGDDDRIVGGEETTIEEYPYQISLERSGSHSCGGSIINANWILTAAHCVQGGSARSFTVRAGSTNRGQGGQRVNVAIVEYDSRFSNSRLSYDVALLKLAEPLNLGKSVQPIELAKAGEEPQAGETVTITGWGTLHSGDWGLPTVLNVVDVDVVDRKECEKAYASMNPIHSTMVCAGRKGKDSCQGDSGGPLVNKKTQKQVGIVSWGRGCAYDGYPGVYCNVADQEINDYINSILSKHGAF